MRRIRGIIATFILCCFWVAPVAAQDASPAAGGTELNAADLGLSEMTITATDTAYEGIPSEVAAGRYLVTLTNQTSGPAIAAFVQPPSDMSTDDVIAVMHAAGATPEAGGSDGNATGSPVASEDQGPPSWYYDVNLPGGPAADAGKTGQAIIDLLPGEYVVWGDDPTAPQEPVALTVTGEAPAAGEDPATADVTIREQNTNDGFHFAVEGTAKAGQNLFKIVDESDQPHFTLLLKANDDVTLDQVNQLLQMDMTGATPTADSGLPNPDEWQTAFYAATQSKGTTQWGVANLETGSYVLFCFVGDPTKGGVPHAFEGMAEIIHVS